MHISITGRLGSGKSTVAKLLATSEGFEIYSTGTIQRKIAADMGLTTLQMNQLMNSDHKYDHMLDDTVTKISVERANETLLFDSRMAWHFARNSFKVYLFVATDVAARRVMRDCRGSVECYASVEDAIEQLNARMLAENVRYRELYGVDHLDLNNFDLDLVASRKNFCGVYAAVCRELSTGYETVGLVADVYANFVLIYVDNNALDDLAVADTNESLFKLFCKRCFGGLIRLSSSLLYSIFDSLFDGLCNSFCCGFGRYGFFLDDGFKFAHGSNDLLNYAFRR